MCAALDVASIELVWKCARAERTDASCDEQLDGPVMSGRDETEGLKWEVGGGSWKREAGSYD